MRPPARKGVFSEPLPVDDILEIGGQDDTNETLTRRMLLLLEGEWVFNEPVFHDVRNRLLQRYLHDEPGEDKICMFLLNDIIRYWRTICIDVEHKTYDGNKAREIRLVKLRFSRMLLYASGVFAIGEGHGLSIGDKAESLHDLFGRYPIDRIASVVGEGVTPVLERYAGFLRALDTPEIRHSLENDGRSSQAFEVLAECAGQFRDDLHGLLQRHFPEDNPIIRALLL